MKNKILSLFLFIVMVWPLAGGRLALAEEEGALPGGELVKKIKETIISLSFTRADLKATLVAMGKLYELNILAGDDVKGIVTVNLKDVSIADALKSILRMNDYTYVVEGNILRIVGLEEDKVTDVVNLNFIEGSLASELAGKLLSEGAVVKVNELMNQLVITDKLINIDKVRDFLAKIDLPPQQVMIEAKLLDISHSDLDNLGISWTGAVNVRVPISMDDLSSRTTHKGGDVKLTTFDGSMAGTSSDLTGGQMTLGFTQGSSTLDITLDALIRNQKANLLASPTIAALNGVEAKINIGEKYPIREQTQTTTGTLETTRFVDIGITLKVTPKISRDGYVQMAIHPEVSSLNSTLDAGPRITTREADTTVIIPDGQTVVIAGLIKNDATVTNDKVPVLGYLPIVGLFFSNRSKSIDQKELAIFITPRIMPVSRQKASQIGGSFSGIGSNLDVMSLYQYARDMESPRSLAARTKSQVMRNLDAAKSYEELAETFPVHPLAAESLYRAGNIYYNKLHDNKEALRVFKILSGRYGDTSYGKEAKPIIAKIEKGLKRGGRR